MRKAPAPRMRSKYKANTYGNYSNIIDWEIAYFLIPAAMFIAGLVVGIYV